MKSLFVADVTWPEVKQALDQGAVAVLPVAAASKQHGWHLPMNTDLLQAQWLCERLAERASVAVWPALSYGHYPAFVDYPGSCSLSHETFVQLTVQILSDIARAGAHSIVVINTGISTIPPLQEAILQCSAAVSVRLANVYAGPHVKSVIARIQEQACGSHADEIETSIMLVVAPAKVHMEKAQACTRPMVTGALKRNDASHPNYSPTGVYGDPCLASAEKGRQLTEAMLDDLLELV